MSPAVKAKRRSWWRRIVLAGLVTTACLAVRGSSAQNTDATADDGTSACPNRVGFVFQGASGRYYAGIAQRGGDSFFGVVYYSFNTIPDQSGTWTASGSFYVYGLECRLATLLNNQGILLPPMERLEYVEGPRVACTGGNGGTGFQTASYSAYDPYSDSQCGDGGSPEGGATNCAQEWVVIERSDDGGKTWYTIWEGYGMVCQ